MNKQLILIALIYLIIINIVSALLAYSDKKRAQRGKWRIPESTLMLLGLFGGAFLEYIVMKKIHHKTRHAKFMIGLPFEIFIHCILIIITAVKVASI